MWARSTCVKSALSKFHSTFTKLECTRLLAHTVKWILVWYVAAKMNYSTNDKTWPGWQLILNVQEVVNCFLVPTVSYSTYLYKMVNYFLDKQYTTTIFYINWFLHGCFKFFFCGCGLHMSKKSNFYSTLAIWKWAKLIEHTVYIMRYNLAILNWFIHIAVRESECRFLATGWGLCCTGIYDECWLSYHWFSSFKLGV